MGSGSNSSESKGKGYEPHACEKYKLYERGKGPNPCAHKGKGKGYEPHGGSLPQGPLAIQDRGPFLSMSEPLESFYHVGPKREDRAFDVARPCNTPPIAAPTVLDSPTESCTTPNARRER